MGVVSNPFVFAPPSSAVSDTFVFGPALPVGAALSETFFFSAEQTGGTPLPIPVLFPYEPNASDSITETISYVTNVITSRNDSERRMGLRQRPVVTLKWRVTAMEPEDAGKLAGMLYKQVNNRWYVPIWPDARQIKTLAGNVYGVDTVGARFNYSGVALVWKDANHFDLMSVTNVAAESVTLVGTHTFDHTVAGIVVIPVGVGSLPQSFTVSRTDLITGGVFEFTLDTTATTISSPLAPSQTFRGVEVLTLHPAMENNLEEKWTISSERVGTELGPFLIRPFATTPIVSHPGAWVLTSHQEIADFRAWLAARRGRRSPLWVSTYQDDFTLWSAALINAGSIDIYAVNFEDNYLGTASRVHLAALFPNGGISPLTVTVVETLAPGVERLFLEVPLSRALPLGTRLTLLVYARLAEDSVIIEHLGPGLATASGSFIELPRETPA